MVVLSLIDVVFLSKIQLLFILRLLTNKKIILGLRQTSAFEKLMCADLLSILSVAILTVTVPDSEKNI